MHFKYDQEAVAYLKKKDAALSTAIDAIGHINRPLDQDLFSSVVHHIIGQQISTAAQATVWARIQAALGEVSAPSVASASVEELQKCGITFKKAEYIKAFAESVLTGDLILHELHTKSDEEIIKTLSSIKGIGVWTAEMIMLFCLNRPDILSFGDLAIHRGLRMLHRHRKITPALFEKYRRRYSPYCSTASLYIWAVAGGATPHLTDPAPKTKPKPKSAKLKK